MKLCHRVLCRSHEDCLKMHIQSKEESAAKICSNLAGRQVRWATSQDPIHRINKPPATSERAPPSTSMLLFEAPEAAYVCFISGPAFIQKAIGERQGHPPQAQLDVTFLTIRR